MEEKNTPSQGTAMQAGDKDLEEIGVKMKDLTEEAMDPEEIRAERKPEPLRPEAPLTDWEKESEEDRKRKANAEKAVRVLGRVFALAAADTLLAVMCLTGKIDLAYGLLFLAGTSAMLGAKVENARL